MSDFYCETPDSGEPPCAGIVTLRADNERLTRELGVRLTQVETHVQANLRLERELAEARGVLREARSCIPGNHKFMLRRIDAFLTTADQPDLAAYLEPCPYCGIRATASIHNCPASVPVPTNTDQAAMMVLLGTGYLREHAPERLRSTTDQPEAVICDACDRVRHQWQRECADTDSLLQTLGLCPSEYRSDGGSLLLGRISHKLASIAAAKPEAK